jgi:hypothetical protein
VAGASGLAGCLSAPTAGGPRSPEPGTGSGTAGDRETTPGTAGATGSSGASPSRPPPADELSLPVERSALTRGADRDAIPAVVDPAFVAADEATLAADDLVIGVARDGRARAYPLAVLEGHEVVNDEFGGPLLVTYCPICASAVTARRTVREEPTVFGVSGLLFRSDLVLYDRRTDSLWSQILARAIRGPATGDRLAMVPSTTTTWARWRAATPETTVLVGPPESETVDPAFVGTQAGYAGRGGVGVSPGAATGGTDDRLPRGTRVYGVANGGEAVAYPREAVRAAGGVVQDRVGDRPVVVATGPTLHAYDRRVDGRTLSFSPAGDGRLRGGESEWLVATGRAVSGPYEGRRLRPAGDGSAMLWFAWAAFHPDTAVYGLDRR